jgi:hypothetical protein
VLGRIVKVSDLIPTELMRAEDKRFIADMQAGLPTTQDKPSQSPILASLKIP